MNRRVNLNILVFSIGFLVMIGWLANSVVSFKTVERPYTLTAEFENAFGVLKNAEVAYIGVPVGQVTQVERITGGVKVTMDIDRGKKIPKNSTANIQRKSAIGEQFIDFYPPRGNDLVAGHYAGGDHIDRERTTVPLEFSEFLRSASALLGAIDPDEFGTIVHESAVGLQGREDSLRQLAEAGDKLTSTIASRTEALDRISANGGRLTRTVTEHRDSLGEVVDNLADINAALDASKGDVATLLDQGAPLLKQVAGLVAKHKTDLDCDLRVLEVVIDHTTTPKVLAGLRALLTFAPPAFGAVWDTRDIEADGVWVRVSPINAPVSDPPQQFNPPRPLPPVVPSPECDSTIAPTMTYAAASTPAPSPLQDRRGFGIAAGLLALGAAFVVRSATKMVS